MTRRSLVIGRECDELGEGGCQVDGHQDHRVQARDAAAQACPVVTNFVDPTPKHTIHLIEQIQVVLPRLGSEQGPCNG